jgi:hypothetical protein
VAADPVVPSVPETQARRERLPFLGLGGFALGRRVPLAAGATIACMLLWFIPSNGGSELALAAYALLALPFAGLQVVPFVLLAHRAHAAAGSAAHQRGLYTGFLTAAEKVGLALVFLLTSLLVLPSRATT